MAENKSPITSPPSTVRYRKKGMAGWFNSKLGEEKGELFKENKWRFWFLFAVGLQILNGALTWYFFPGNLGALLFCAGALLCWLFVAFMHYTDSGDKQIDHGVAILDSIALIFAVIHFSVLVWIIGHAAILEKSEVDYNAQRVEYNKQIEAKNSQALEKAKIEADRARVERDRAKLEASAAYWSAKGDGSAKARAPKPAAQAAPQSGVDEHLDSLEKPTRPDGETSAEFKARMDWWVRILGGGELLIAVITLIYIRYFSVRANHAGKSAQSPSLSGSSQGASQGANDPEYQEYLAWKMAQSSEGGEAPHRTDYRAQTDRGEVAAGSHPIEVADGRRVVGFAPSLLPDFQAGRVVDPGQTLEANPRQIPHQENLIYGPPQRIGYGVKLAQDLAEFEAVERPEIGTGSAPVSETKLATETGPEFGAENGRFSRSNLVPNADQKTAENRPLSENRKVPTMVAPESTYYGRDFEGTSTRPKSDQLPVEVSDQIPDGKPAANLGEKPAKKSAEKSPVEQAEADDEKKRRKRPCPIPSMAGYTWVYKAGKDRWECWKGSNRRSGDKGVYLGGVGKRQLASWVKQYGTNKTDLLPVVRQWIGEQETKRSPETT